MTWPTWLTAAVVVTALAAITGLTPTGGRQVSGTHLMGVARLVLAVVALTCLYLAYRARLGV